MISKLNKLIFRVYNKDLEFHISRHRSDKVLQYQNLAHSSFPLNLKLYN